ncbi:MAG: hypothetical protein GY715_05955 [Planctomycetes bacterium]|nr:hypothetical protein [Planctomycetota bacterium]
MSDNHPFFNPSTGLLGAVAPVADPPSATGDQSYQPSTTPPAPAAEGTPGAQPAPGQPVYFTSENEYEADLMKESLALPLMVMLICLGMTLLVNAARGWADAGLLGVAFSSVAMIVALGIVSTLNTGVGWVVGKMFGTDLGSVGSLFLRICSVNSAHGLALVGLTTVMNPLLGLVLGVPVYIALVVWLVGMDLVQALIFTVIVCVVNIVVTTLVLASIMAAAVSAAG